MGSSCAIEGEFRDGCECSLAGNCDYTLEVMRPVKHGSAGFYLGNRTKGDADVNIGGDRQRRSIN